MSTLKTNNVQVGQSATATNNFTLYQPATPDGTVRLGVGNSGATSADAVIVDNAGLFKFNSGYGSAATAYGCRAWVNFDGTGTVAIRASGNVTSITDNSTGNYTVNFTTALVDANYGVGLGIQKQTSGVAGLSRNISSTTSAYRFFTTDGSGTALDVEYLNVAIFR
jgi:hypothetical protein